MWFAAIREIIAQAEAHATKKRKKMPVMHSQIKGYARIGLAAPYAFAVLVILPREKERTAEGSANGPTGSGVPSKSTISRVR